MRLAICIDLFVFGLGMGFAMMPIFTGAMQSVTAAAAARASTALNIIQQTGASIGTAVLSVLLATELADQLGHGSHGTIGATAVSGGRYARTSPGRWRRPSATRSCGRACCSSSR